MDQATLQSALAWGNPPLLWPSPTGAAQPRPPAGPASAPSGIMPMQLGRTQFSRSMRQQLLPGLSLPAGSKTCTDCSAKRWNNTAVSLWHLDSSVPLPHQLGQDFSLWARRTALFRLCIDYRALNRFSRMNTNRLHLRPLHKARIFTKLDLVTPTTWCAFVMMNGRLLPDGWGTSSIWSCPSG